MEFIPEVVVNDMNLLLNKLDIIVELARIVKEDGIMASINGLHLIIQELY